MIKRNGPGSNPGLEGSLLHKNSGLPTTGNPCAQVASTSSGFAGLLCAELRCAHSRARLIVNEIECISTTLRGGFITADGAIEWMADIGALGLIATSSSFISLTTQEGKQNDSVYPT